MYITHVKAREILDSRGNPTIEVELGTGKFKVREQVPSGASTGMFEALELRDDTKRYDGKGVEKAVKNINTIISKKIKGMSVEQELIDQTLIELDGTEAKEKLGANAILGVSLATARLKARLDKVPLYRSLEKKFLMPVPFMNIINGGKHAENELPIQEYMIAPCGKNFKESLRIGSEVYHELKSIIAHKYGKSQTNIGDEGGFAPNITNIEEPLELMQKAVKELGYEREVKFAMDCAASEFYHPLKESKIQHGIGKKLHRMLGSYYVDKEFINYGQLAKKYQDLIKRFPLVSIEDPFDQNAFEHWSDFNKHFGKKIQIVGDDLLVTNTRRIEIAARHKACNALLLKVNQIGTLTEAMKAAKMAMNNNWNIMVSHRSGETNSSFISDLAVALRCGQIKAGAPCRGERIAKYNQLLRIEEECKARYAGKYLK